VLCSDFYRYFDKNSDQVPTFYSIGRTTYAAIVTDQSVSDSICRFLFRRAHVRARALSPSRTRIRAYVESGESELIRAIVREDADAASAVLAYRG